MQFTDFGPSKKQVKVMLPRVADPTEKLETVPDANMLAFPGPGLGHRSGQSPAVVPFGQNECREIHQCTSPFNQAIHVGQLVFDSLERTDRHTELPPLLDVVEVQLEDPLTRTKR